MANVFITGAGKGLGRATAEELTKRGHHVIATARNLRALDDLAVAKRLQLDVTDDDSVARAAKEAGHVDVLINNAAEIFYAPLESGPLAEAKRLYDINVFGMLRTIQALVPAMRERRAGTVVNISSVVGRVALPLTGIYSSTKWAIEGLSESLRSELERFGVRVVLVEPGMIGTGALDAPRTYLTADDPYSTLHQARPPREQMTSPQTVAGVVADAAEHPEQQFRWIVGDDAKALLSQRAKLDDAAFHGFMRDQLGAR